MKLLTFTDWLVETSRPLRKLGDLDINRKFKGERYEYELFPRFKRLQARIKQLERKPKLEEWFDMMQNSDAEFYTLVQTDVLGQPDVRELWRDLTGNRSAKMRKYNLAESLDSNVASWKSKIDPDWTVVAVWPEDSIYGDCAELFEKFGIAFADLESMTVFIDGEKIEEENLSSDHLLAIEAHEIAHYALEHTAPRENSNYNEIQEREADWFGIMLLTEMGYNEAARLLENRYFEYYGAHPAELDEDPELNSKLNNYLKK